MGEFTTTVFYQDCSKHTLAVPLTQYGARCIIHAEPSIKLAQKREGQNVGRDEWGAHTVGVHVGPQGIFSQVRVSGCRSFCTIPKGVYGEIEVPFYSQIYDLNYAGRVKHLRAGVGANEGGGTRRI